MVRFGFRLRRSPLRLTTTSGLVLSVLFATSTLAASDRKPAGPSVLLVTIDALRADRLGCYGYQLPTSPAIDDLLAGGTRFTKAWTVEPLTNPALTSMLTSKYPHDHGATRNGLRMRSGLASLPRTLKEHGYETAALVSNWTLKDELSRMGEHFDYFGEVLTRHRWFGLFTQEAVAEDVTDRALRWVASQRRRNPDTPFFLWVHYVEPHAPYRYHPASGKVLGIDKGSARKSDRYDTEVHAVDAEVGRLLEGLRSQGLGDTMLIGFSADHGESLGEHDYWGHGRNLYDPALRIPMGMVWPGHIPPGTTDQPALIIDLAPTILDLLDIPVPKDFAGVSWADAFTKGPAPDRPFLCFQAHKGAVQVKHESDRARTKGLLEVGVIRDGVKDILDLRKPRRHMVFDLLSDPAELRDLAGPDRPESEALMSCFGEVISGLESLDGLNVSRLSDDDREQLRALGYLD